MKGRVFFSTVLLSTFIVGLACSGQKKETQDKKASEQVPKSTISTGVEAKELAGKHLVTFVELGSVRCVPCKMMQPIMREIEKEYAGKVKVVFYDVWTPEGRPYAQRYRIRVIPTQVFLDEDGREYFRHEGYFPKEEILKVLEQKGVRR